MDPKEAENMQRIGEAAFNAGWYAACQTVAAMCAKAGAHPQTVQTFRDLAAEPPALKVGDLTTPEGQAMKRGAETVMVQTFPRGATAKPKED